MTRTRDRGGDSPGRCGGRGTGRQGANARLIPRSTAIRPLGAGCDLRDTTSFTLSFKILGLMGASSS